MKQAKLQRLDWTLYPWVHCSMIAIPGNISARSRSIVACFDKSRCRVSVSYLRGRRVVFWSKFKRWWKEL